MLQIREYKVDDVAKLKDPDTEVVADVTFTFALNDARYEIDLSQQNADKIRKQLEPWQKAGRRVRSSSRSSRRRPTAARQKSASIRDWARDRGYKVSDRGRIPVDVIAEYEAAHQAA